ncbi:MAG: hypothetical protein KDC05_12650 [Bacteroidales bacterium]|nr:hypothetical protein [Bacteroidales bacterium]
MKKLTRTVSLLFILCCTSCAKDTIEFNPGIQYGSFTDTRNNEVYKTVQIGDQTWMAENLRSISTDPHEVNCCNYGKLYMHGAAEEACPEGWHMPDSSEWQILINYLGGNNIAGGKLKETGTTHWDAPNKGATNSSGFTALGAGFADYDLGLQKRMKQAEFWTSSEYPPGYNVSSYYFVSLSNSSTSATWLISDDDFELMERKSVRCIKN